MYSYVQEELCGSEPDRLVMGYDGFINPAAVVNPTAGYTLLRRSGVSNSAVGERGELIG